MQRGNYFNNVDLSKGIQEGWSFIEHYLIQIYDGASIVITAPFWNHLWRTTST